MVLHDVVFVDIDHEDVSAIANRVGNNGEIRKGISNDRRVRSQDFADECPYLWGNGSG